MEYLDSYDVAIFCTQTCQTVKSMYAKLKTNKWDDDYLPPLQSIIKDETLSALFGDMVGNQVMVTNNLSGNEYQIAKKIPMGRMDIQRTKREFFVYTQTMEREYDYGY